MLSLFNSYNIRFHEHLILNEIVQQNILPFYPLLVSFLYFFIMATIAFSKSNKQMNNQESEEKLIGRNLLRYDKNTSLIIKKLADKNSQETILILRKEK